MKRVLLTDAFLCILASIGTGMASAMLTNSPTGNLGVITSATATPTCAASWAIVSSPNPGLYNKLTGVVAVAANNIWAAGRYLNNQDTDRTLVEHWNGST